MPAPEHSNSHKSNNIMNENENANARNHNVDLFRNDSGNETISICPFSRYFLCRCDWLGFTFAERAISANIGDDRQSGSVKWCLGALNDINDECLLLIKLKSRLSLCHRSSECVCCERKPINVKHEFYIQHFDSNCPKFFFIYTFLHSFYKNMVNSVRRAKAMDKASSLAS